MLLAGGWDGAGVGVCAASSTDNPGLVLFLLSGAHTASRALLHSRGSTRSWGDPARRADPG